MTKELYQLALSILGALLFQACAHGGPAGKAASDPDAELCSSLAFATGQTRVEAVRLPWEADARIARFAKERTRRARTEFQRLTSLLAWFREQNFPADYNRLGSLTAVEAFDRAVERQPDNPHYRRFLQAARDADRWQRNAWREDSPEPDEPEPAT